MLVPLLLASLLAAGPEPINTNDMRVPAGTLRDGVLTLSLEARKGAWYPDGPQGMVRNVYAFAESDGALQNPGPLIRVPQGTRVKVHMHNALELPMWIYGLGAKRGIMSDSVLLEPGETHEFTFVASDVGSFYYTGKTAKVFVLGRDLDDSQLNGAIIVDPPGAMPNDRIFLISWWGGEDSTTVSHLQDGATIVINGLSWPFTERMKVVQNEPQHWRWINVTALTHPMHLHGFYFSVDGRGDGASFTDIAPELRPMTVTESVAVGGAFHMTWTPKKPGNWIMHCHFATHVALLEDLNRDRRYPAKPTSHEHHSDRHMEGLVMGIQVAARGELKASERAPRPIRLVAQSQPNIYGEYAGYSYSVGDVDSFRAPGPMLLLEKDEPVAVNIVNKSHEPQAVHWHGIELDSYPDGVPYWSGMGSNVLKPVPAGDSMTITFTPPRAGTFMYHAHLNENQQISSGMYGPIVVLEKGRAFDAETDRIMLLSDNGPTINLIKGPYPAVLLNGKLEHEPMQLRVGTTYRFRIISIRSDDRARIELLDNGEPVQWKHVARDGMDLPAAQVTMTPAKLITWPGQIYDVEFTPARAGELVLRFGYAQDAPELPKAHEVRVLVR